MATKTKKLFVVQKLVFAESIEEALRLEKKQRPLSIYIEDDWKKTHIDKPEHLD